jgi:toxin ParE1/3/4
MRTLRFANKATFDIQSILDWTEEQFGPQARARYAALMFQAAKDVAANANRIGVQRRKDLPSGILIYPIALSRKKIPSRLARVKRPRHLLAFRVVSPQIIEVIRILHDSSDLVRHLPPLQEPRGEDEVD